MFAEHIQANYQFASGLMCWLSFWAVDMNSSIVPESKIYQAKIWQRGKEHELHLFRLKPTDEGDSLFVSALLFFWLLSLYSHLNLCVQRLLLLKWSLLLPCYVKTLVLFFSSLSLKILVDKSLLYLTTLCFALV